MNRIHLCLFPLLLMSVVARLDSGNNLHAITNDLLFENVVHKSSKTKKKQQRNVKFHSKMT